MKRLGLIGWANMLAVLPLLFGSTVFFFWFYQRHWYAVDARIEGLAACALLSYFLLGLATLVLCSLSVLKEPGKWSRVLAPLSILVFTWLMVDLYDTHYHSDERAYLRVDVRGSDILEVTLWSSHFQTSKRADPRKTDLVFIFSPTYTYDWSKEYSFDSAHSIDSVFISIHRGARGETYLLSSMDKKECRTLTYAELIALPRALSMEEQYGKVQYFGD